MHGAKLLAGELPESGSAQRHADELAANSSTVSGCAAARTGASAARNISGAEKNVPQA